MPSLRRRKKIPITQVGNSEPRKTLAFVCCEKLVSGRPALLVVPRPIISIDRPRAPAVAAQPPPPQASDSQPGKELLVLYPQWRCLLSRRHRLRPVLVPSRRLPCCRAQRPCPWRRRHRPRHNRTGRVMRDLACLVWTRTWLPRPFEGFDSGENSPRHEELQELRASASRYVGTGRR